MNLFRLNAIIGTLPVTLANGTTADATQVMSDLNWIVNQVNANAAPLSGVALLASANTFTEVQSGVAAAAAANFPIASQVQNQVFNTLSSTLGTNTITARVAVMAPSAYAAGQVFTFVPSQTNTGPASLNVNSLNSAIIYSGGFPTIGGELQIGVPQSVEHDGSKFNIISPSQASFTFTPFVGSSGGGSPGAYVYALGETNRIGNRHFFSLDILMNTLGSLAPGSIRIGNLPTQLPPITAPSIPVTVNALALGSTINNIQGRMSGNNPNRIDLYTIKSGVEIALRGSDITTSTEFFISGNYSGY